MGIKKFIEGVKESLGLDEFEKAGKKKSIKRLLEKLRSRKKVLEKLSKKEADKERVKDELSIITLQIKKGEKILQGLNAQKSKK